MTMSKISGGSCNRRAALRSIALGAAAIAVPSTVRAAGYRSANDRPVFATIGLRNQGITITSKSLQFADFAALADVDSNVLEANLQGVEKAQKKRPDGYSDYRKILDRKDIDAVMIATPDHWHTKISVEAMLAGKDVYCEKPLTLTVAEGKLIEKIVKQTGRVFQVGTMQRTESDQRFLKAIAIIRDGRIGTVKKVTCSIDRMEASPVIPVVAAPEQIDWDMWLGQAPMVDYIKERCHYQFRWWYEYSGGKFTDWGAHHVDIATWAIGADQEGMGPIEIDGTDAKHPVEFKDGYPTVDDRYNSAHDYAVKCKYENGIEMIVTSRGDNGILFEGTEGRLFVNRGKITGKPIDDKIDEGKFGDEDLVKLYKGKPFEGHKQNFFRCIAEGGLPVSDVFSHVQTMNTCHLAAIAARVGRVIKWDPKAEKIVGDEVAAKLFAREQRKGFEIPRV